MLEYPTDMPVRRRGQVRRKKCFEAWTAITRDLDRVAADFTSVFSENADDAALNLHIIRGNHDRGHL